VIKLGWAGYIATIEKYRPAFEILIDKPNETSTKA